ncbi:SDR family oxidoreductase [Actinotalea sp. M2MS4P-6]|uniref:SDR family oxidoreductase n=1 Tax=Actinotalea sp. M2MS4P-6 TaxID=2983762 RepID=UPI0021E4FDFD|nr:SDR family oxidoreductase [Actinotalea sp. M2MS4P-6]MCV2395785.1 SDR family oxidoreductase [Actinotalea sp. M2MS4P-6]
MATVVIVGGHGRIALELARRLSGRGDRVRSVVRNPEHADDVRAAGAEVVVHDLETGAAADLAAVLAGADAVVFSAGAGAGSGVLRKRTVDLGGALATIDAAKQAGVARLVQVSFLGAALPTAPGTDPVFAAYWDAKRQADDALRGSGLDWTIVKPGRLLDGPGSGSGEVSTADGARGAATRRADIAALVVLALDDPRAVGHELVVTEGDVPLAAALDAALA